MVIHCVESGLPNQSAKGTESPLTLIRTVEILRDVNLGNAAP